MANAHMGSFHPYCFPSATVVALEVCGGTAALQGTWKVCASMCCDLASHTHTRAHTQRRYGDS